MHNGSADIPFLVVTPTFNSEDYLDETILSVISQAGPFEIIYHVQDGGSSDRTIDILRRWKRLIESGDFPRQRSVSGSPTSAPM